MRKARCFRGWLVPSLASCGWCRWLVDGVGVEAVTGMSLYLTVLSVDDKTLTRDRSH